MFAIFILFNKSLIFFHFKFPWKDSIKECCKYGLKPLKINSQEDLDCLVNENKSNVLLYIFNIFMFTVHYFIC